MARPRSTVSTIASSRPPTRMAGSRSSRPTCATADTLRTTAPMGAGKRGAVRIFACHDGQTSESADLADLERMLADPTMNLWIDLAEPDVEQVKLAAKTLGLHPLIAEDIIERN